MPLSVRRQSTFHRPSVPFRGNADGQYHHLYKTDRPADSYASTRWYPDEQFGRKNPDPYLLKILNSYLRPGDAVLELGCNRGNNLLALAQHSNRYQVYGVDLEECYLNNLQKQAQKHSVGKRVHVQQWDFAENGDQPWPQMKGRFKAIYAVHVLSHLSKVHLIKTMQALQQHLTPGGLMMVSILHSAGKDNATLPDVSPMHQGYIHHDPQTVQEAFRGLTMKKQFCRPFLPGELNNSESKGWYLPENCLHWYVFRKPGKIRLSWKALRQKILG